MDQTVTVAAPVPVPPAVRVLNKKGRPMARQRVVFSVASGGGHVSANVQETDKDGIARVGAWILGATAGPQTLQARIPELPPVIISVMSVAAEPATVVSHSGDGQTGVVGTTLAASPSVLVKDLYGNGVEGVTVEFDVTSGGGFVTLPSAQTDVQGIASAGAWTLGTTAEANSLTGSVEGFAPISFTASAVPDVPKRASVLLGGGQVAEVGTELPLRPMVLVADRYGNPLEGVPVEFETQPESGTVASGSQLTGPSGTAVSGPWTLGLSAGPQRLLVHVSELDPVAISAIGKPGPPVSAVLDSGDGQTATVGTPVPIQPTIRVKDAFGNPVPGVSVTFFTNGSPDPDLAPGAIDGAEASTDTGGRAGPEKWTLGTLAGSYGLAAEVSGIAEVVAFSATAKADAPSHLDIHGGDHQTAPFGSTLPLHPWVRVSDQYGNGVEGAVVEFQVVEGGGSLAEGQGTTDALGLATPGGWTLGPLPGPNGVSATLAGVGTVVFQAVGLTAPPVAMEKVAGDQAAAEVGKPVPVPPLIRVIDEDGRPVASVPVVFSVTSGGGSVTQAESLSDAEGLAGVGSWVLGTVAGTNTLSVSAPGLPPVTFVAWGSAGPPVSMSVNDGEDQRAPAGVDVPLPPSVRLEDAYGNPVSGVSVDFSVSAGGGSVSGTPAFSNDDGVARVGSWTLGSAPGTNRLTASSAGIRSLEFTARGTNADEFDIDLEFLASIDPSQAAAFQAAAARWEGIIVGDIPDFDATLPAGGCQPVSEAGGVDDVKVYVTVDSIDGSGGVLGRAGPCYYRTVGGVFPITGVMELDEADLADMLSSGLLEDVIVHEMGHVLGFGTLWNTGSNEFLVGGGTAEPFFNGAGAIAAFDAAGGEARTDPKVPVENTGGPGTRDGHWRESVHNAELMTGWIEGGGVTNPLSAITIASFADMGYTVNISAADPYLLFDPLGAPPQDPSGVRIHIEELPAPTPIPAPGGGSLKEGGKIE